MHFVFLTYFWKAAAEDVLLYHNAYRYLHRPALIFASCLVLVALLISVHLIFSHLRSYTKPAEQKWIVAVLLIVPIYATESIISLWNPRLSLVCDILRNCYEAFALYSFGSYLIACLGGERRVVELLEDESRKMLTERLLKEEGEVPKHPKAFYNFFRRPCLLGKDLLNIEKFGLVQYMILKTLCAFLAFILELFGVYGDGEFKWYYGYPYIAVVINFSQMWALYCLVQFYNVTHEMLKPIKPLAKFISFKAIVFATWWQGVGIALLCSFGVLPKEEKIQTGLQDFLICIEMAIAAVAHIFVFPAKPYRSVQQQHSDYRKIATTETTKAPLKETEGGKADILEKKETKVKCPGTSVKESIQDIVVGGGQHVVKDVVLTINQAIEPVEKGVTKIQETLHKKIKVATPKNDKKQDVKVEEHVDQKKSTLVSEEDDDDNKKQDTEVEEHVEKKKKSTLVSEEDEKKLDTEVEEHVEKKKSTIVSEEEDHKKQDMEIEEHVEKKKSIHVSDDDGKKQDMKVEEHVEQEKSTHVSEEEQEGISQSSAAAVVKRFFFFCCC